MTKIFISTFLLFVSTIFSQTKGRLPNKTIKDSVFSIGDIIKIPELIYQLSYPLGKETIDSLQPISDFLKKYPILKIEISCHTDSQGKDTLNIMLSNFRAKYVWDYLIKEKGIDSNRLNYKGYGETRLIISDSEILKTKTKEEKEQLHKINSRTELKVINVK